MHALQSPTCSSSDRHSLQGWGLYKQGNALHAGNCTDQVGEVPSQSDGHRMRFLTTLHPFCCPSATKYTSQLPTPPFCTYTRAGFESCPPHDCPRPKCRIPRHKWPFKQIKPLRLSTCTGTCRSADFRGRSVEMQEGYQGLHERLLHVCAGPEVPVPVPVPHQVRSIAGLGPPLLG